MNKNEIHPRQEGRELASMRWDGAVLWLLDQTKLPREISWIACSDYARVAEAIRRLEVRGAPAIGAAAAFGIVLGAKQAASCEREDFLVRLRQVADTLLQTRPTAVNLAWAVREMQDVLDKAVSAAPISITEALEAKALAIYELDAEVNAAISAHGAALFDRPVSILTHCNAGALATVAHGTALGVIRAAWRNCHVTRVFADETRPLLQGARLTALELSEEGIPVTRITDSMAGWVMRQGMVDAVIVGADRIARNGDTANKIGTYSVAVLAKEHGIPFYVAAPLSTFDVTLPDGSGIPIEERDPKEILQLADQWIAPPVAVFNPAFDVTPARLISGIITEAGVFRPPYDFLPVVSKQREPKMV